MQEGGLITMTVSLIVDIVVLFRTAKFPPMLLRRVLLVICGVKSSIPDTLPALSLTFPILANPSSS
jgi:hypothetical protein